MKKKRLKTLDELIDEQYGKKGNPKRDKFEKGYQKFKMEESELLKGDTRFSAKAADQPGLSKEGSKVSGTVHGRQKKKLKGVVS